MALTTVYYAIPNPPGGALPEKGPGTPTVPSVPLGQGISVSSGSNAAATFELRVVTDTTKAPVGNWTTMQLILACMRLIYFFRQRGYIGGSGGPASGATFSSTGITATVTTGTAVLTALSSNVLTAGWRVGFAISGGNIAANAVITGISADGLQVMVSGNSGTGATLVAITVTGAAEPVGSQPV